MLSSALHPSSCSYNGRHLCRLGLPSYTGPLPQQTAACHLRFRNHTQPPEGRARRSIVMGEHYPIIGKHTGQFHTQKLFFNGKINKSDFSCPHSALQALCAGACARCGGSVPAGLLIEPAQLALWHTRQVFTNYHIDFVLYCTSILYSGVLADGCGASRLHDCDGSAWQQVPISKGWGQHLRTAW